MEYHPVEANYEKNTWESFVSSFHRSHKRPRQIFSLLDFLPGLVIFFPTIQETNKLVFFQFELKPFNWFPGRMACFALNISRVILIMVFCIRRHYQVLRFPTSHYIIFLLSTNGNFPRADVSLCKLKWQSNCIMDL